MDQIPGILPDIRPIIYDEDSSIIARKYPLQLLTVFRTTRILPRYDPIGKIFALRIDQLDNLSGVASGAHRVDVQLVQLPDPVKEGL